MTSHVSVEFPESLWDKVRLHAKKYGRKEGHSTLEFLLDDASKYRARVEPQEGVHLRLLRQWGFRYCYQHALYVSPSERKAISIEFVEQMTPIGFISHFLERPSLPCPKWMFLFVGGDPSKGVKLELSKSLDILYPSK